MKANIKDQIKNMKKIYSIKYQYQFVFMYSNLFFYFFQ
jgi:hypothetical protein